MTAPPPEPSASDGAAHSAAPSAHPGTGPTDTRMAMGTPGSRSPVGAGSGASRAAVRTRQTVAGTGGLLLMLVTAFVGTAGVLWVATQTVRGQIWDERARRSVGASARAWVHIVDPLTAITIGSVAACLAALVAVAVMRHRYALAVAAVVLVAGANATTQVVKRAIVPRPDLHENSAPSGHTTVAMSVCLAALIVAPVAVRMWLLPLAGFIATFVGAGTLVGQWHRPADVVAGYGVCLGWAAMALGMAHVAQRHDGPLAVKRGGRPGWSLTGSSAVGLAFVLLGVRPVADDVHLVVAALALGVIGIVSALVVAWVSTAADHVVG